EAFRRRCPDRLPLGEFHLHRIRGSDRRAGNEEKKGEGACRGDSPCQPTQHHGVLRQEGEPRMKFDVLPNKKDSAQPVWVIHSLRFAAPMQGSGCKVLAPRRGEAAKRWRKRTN